MFFGNHDDWFPRLQLQFFYHHINRLDVDECPAGCSGRDTAHPDRSRPDAATWYAVQGPGRPQAPRPCRQGRIVARSPAPGYAGTVSPARRFGSPAAARVSPGRTQPDPGFPTIRCIPPVPCLPHHSGLLTDTAPVNKPHLRITSPGR